MTEWLSYSLRDFIPFTEEVYLRLLERVNEQFWPLHLLMAALVIAMLYLLVRKHTLYALKLLAMVWAWQSYGFMERFYAELNWAGELFAIACLIQAVLLLILAHGRSLPTNIHTPALFYTGFLLTGIAMLWPLFSPLGRSTWTGLEFFGIHADPTAVMTLGILLATMNGWRLWLLAIIPLIWLVISMVTLKVLALAQFGVLLGIIILFIVALFINAFTRTRSTNAHWK